MKRSEALEHLGLSGYPTDDEINKAWRKTIKKVHPDLFQDPAKKKWAEERSMLVNEAHDVLISGKWDPETSHTHTSSAYSEPEPTRRSEPKPDPESAWTDHQQQSQTNAHTSYESNKTTAEATYEHAKEEASTTGPSAGFHFDPHNLIRPLIGLAITVALFFLAFNEPRMFIRFTTPFPVPMFAWQAITFLFLGFLLRGLFGMLFKTEAGCGVKAGLFIGILIFADSIPFLDIAITVIVVVWGICGTVADLVGEQ